MWILEYLAEAHVIRTADWDWEAGDSLSAGLDTMCWAFDGSPTGVLDLISQTSCVL
jgi:hypothetical protein